MNNILLGHDATSNRPIHISRKSFDTHWHLIGGTGKGKTTAIISLLHKLLMDPLHNDCHVIIDRMGSFSQQLLMWMASRYCTQRVRDRLIYFDAAREDAVLPFNPLVYDTQANGHYKVSRATEIILRGWESQNIEAMPRLARWIFNAFWSAAQLGLTISDCVHFLMPGSPLHEQLIACLPDRLRYEWSEITDGRNSEVSRILESARNRLKPYFENDILRRMFGGTANRLDILQFMKQGKILIVNLAPQNRLSPQVADAIGGLIINEVLATVRSLPGGERYPTFLWLDEFQRFVGPDLEEAIPEVRQLGLKLILSHQSLGQLKRGEFDMTSMMFVPQSRMVFGVQGKDADDLAHEFATINYDLMQVKDERYTLRQLHSGYKIMELEGFSESDSFSQSNSYSFGRTDTNGESVLHAPRDTDGPKRDSYSSGFSNSNSTQQGSSRGTSTSRSRMQTLVPQYRTFEELATRNYVSFQEQRTLWSQKIRQLKTGCELMRIVDDPNIYEIDVKRSAPGFLAFDMQTIHKRFPKAIEDTNRLIEQNIENGPFCSPREIELETTQRLERVIRERLPTPAMAPAITATPQPAAEPNPFL